MLDDGRKVTVELFRKIVREELDRLRAQHGAAAFAAGQFEPPRRIPSRPDSDRRLHGSRRSTVATLSSASRRPVPTRKLFGIRLSDRGVPRQGYPVWRGDERVGEVCSGNFSPTLGAGVGFAYGAAGNVPAPGDVVEIEAHQGTDEGGYS